MDAHDRGMYPSDDGAGIRAVILDEGAARGLRVLEVRSGGGLDIDVIVDRALDIGSARYRGSTIGWTRPGGPRHPSYFGPADDGGYGWLRDFSGLLMTGGLDHIFGPVSEPAPQFTYAQAAHAWHPLHGRVAHLPAESCAWGETRDADRERVLWIEGRVRQFSLAGEHLVLSRRLEVPIGGSTIRVHDRVTNAGFEPAPHGLLYHVNVGWPLLSPDTRLETSSRGRSVRLSGPPDGSPFQIPSAAPAAGEIVDIHEFDDARDERWAAFRNRRTGLGLVVEYHASQLPVLVQWVLARAGSYVAALEPSTHAPGTAHADTLLAPGETREYRLALRVEADATLPSVY